MFVFCGNNGHKTNHNLDSLRSESDKNGFQVVIQTPPPSPPWAWAGPLGGGGWLPLGVANTRGPLPTPAPGGARAGASHTGAPSLFGFGFLGAGLLAVSLYPGMGGVKG